jgi:hypothetical protein
MPPKAAAKGKDKGPGKKAE